MTPLRQRFLDDLRLRNYAPRTLQTYVAAVARFARHFGRSPEFLGPADIRAYQLHLLDHEHASWSRFNQTVCALRFLYRVTLQRPELLPVLPFGKRPKTIPAVLSPEEVLRIFAALKDNPFRTLIRLTYACGLRLGEVVRLRVGDIDSARGVLVIHQGKGHKDRLVPLTPALLDELRGYWRRYRPGPWLFPGEKEGQHVHRGTVQRYFRQLVRRLGLAKRVSMHTLRHSYATHLLEAGVDVVTLQHLLGHRQLSTTAGYLHISTRHLARLPCPLDTLRATPLPAATAQEPQP